VRQVRAHLVLPPGEGPGLDEQRVGGLARRGALSDSFIELCMASSDYAIVVEAGNQDGFFTKLAAKANIAVTMVERISSIGAPLAAAFK